jgi:predicted nucleic acid-binding protein
MKYTADTWFLIKLITGDEEAIKIKDEVIEGKSRLVIPTIVIAELVREMVRKGNPSMVNSLMRSLLVSSKITIANLDQMIAMEAGKMGITFNIPLVDSTILATAIIFEHTSILTNDEHYKLAEKRDRIKRVFW